jgi:hypothetical protein
MPVIKSYYDIVDDMLMEDMWRRMHRAPSIRTTPLTVWRIEDTHSFDPTKPDGLGARRCTVSLRGAGDGTVRTVTVPCDTIGTYRIGDTYEERIEKVG